MTGRTKSQHSIDSKILTAIKKRGPGAVFVPVEFLEFGSREGIDVALHRLTKEGVIRRLARGLYDLPRKHQILGTLAPSAEAVAWAVAGRDRTRLQPAGANAANILGLTTHVPAKMVFLTDGPARTVRIGPMTIQLRRSTPKQMEGSGRLIGLLIQAFKDLGREHITSQRREHLKRTLPLEKRRGLLEDLRLAPTWMHPIIRELAEVDT